MSSEVVKQTTRYIFSSPSRRRKILFILLFIFSLPLCLFLLLPSFRGLPDGLSHAQRTLLVTAHPDDEALFFNPTIIAITKHHSLDLIVLSRGNNYGIGDLRQSEQRGSCSVLGIDHCEVLNELQDDPHAWWPHEIVQKQVDTYGKRWQIDSLVTFDNGGVSGHINHRAVSDAVIRYGLSHNIPTYLLTTTSVLRKYTIIGDLPLTLLKTGGNGLLVNTITDYWKGIRAFRSHASQFVWDRYLYVILSRYMWFNDIRPATPADISDLR